MKIVFLLFQRVGIKSLSEMTFFQEINEKHEVKVFKITHFFSEKLRVILRGNSNTHFIGLNYPLETREDEKKVRQFILNSLHSDSNLYFFPKPNLYLEIDDFALFSLKKFFTFDNYEIELSYRRGNLERNLRNKIHQFLRSSLGVSEKIVNKKFFYESRKLFNLSYQWVEYTFPKEEVVHDLTHRIHLFYPAPKTINIGLTNSCNLACSMCLFHAPHYKLTHKTSFFKDKIILREDIVYQIIDYAIKNECYSIDFTSPGESLLDKRIFDFIQYARRKSNSIKLGLVTNAVLLTKKVSQKLLDSGLDVATFSLDGVSSHIYKKIRGVNLSQVEENVKYFIELSKHYDNIQINLNCIINDDTKSEKEAYLQKWKSYNQNIIVNFQALLISDLDCSVTVENKHKQLPKDRMVCSRPWNSQLGVFPDGTINICCTMGGMIGWKDYKIANIYDSSLEEIWLHQLFSIREALLKNDFSYYDCCTNCSEWSWDIIEENLNQTISVFREFN